MLYSFSTIHTKTLNIPSLMVPKFRLNKKLGNKPEF